MFLSNAIIKVSDMRISRSWYSSLFFQDPSFQDEGICSWKSGVTIVTEKKWLEAFSFGHDEVAVPSTSIVMEVPSFDSFLRFLSLRNDRSSIVIGEGSYNGRRLVKLIDPDMNVVVVVESEKESAVLGDEERTGEGKFSPSICCEMSGATPKKE
ncbi:MAG: hypothetical protein ACI4S4_06580 [Candidatus Ornithospirochaeta sp.]